MKHNVRFFTVIVIVFIFAVSGFNSRLANAGELTLTPSITSSVSVFNSEFDDTSQTERAITLAPGLSTVYAGRHASLSMLLKHSALIRDDEGSSSGDSYTDVKLASQIDIIENLLSFEVSASQSYRAINQSQFYFSDRISSPNDLTKMQADKALLSFNLPNSPYIGLNWQASISHTKTDNAVNNISGVDSSNILFAANIFQGKKVNNFSYSFSVQHNNTTRNTLDNFKSNNYSGKVGIRLVNNFSILAQGRVDDYDSETLNLNFSRPNLDTESYGAGIRWQPRDSRVIELTFNQLKEDENTSGFVGASTQWAFSNRTSMSFDYGKRFYGDAYSFSFDYNLKSFRASMSYNEDVTTFARLGTTTQDGGIFVCSFGSSELEDCFQPDSLDYILQPGEEFRSLTEISSDISDDVIFRKNGNINIGYEKRKLKASLTVTRGTVDYLESDRETTRTSASININYALGRRSNVALVTSVSRQSTGEESNNTKTFLSTLTFNRSINQHLEADLSVRYSKQNRDSNDTFPDFTSSTINASLIYQF